MATRQLTIDDFATLTKKQLASINREVRSIISIINAKLVEARERYHEKKTDSIIVKGPKTIPIEGLNDKLATDEVYSRVLENLMSPERGFDVHISENAHYKFININLINLENAKRMKRQKFILEYAKKLPSERKNYKKPMFEY